MTGFSSIGGKSFKCCTFFILNLFLITRLQRGELIFISVLICTIIIIVIGFEHFKIFNQSHYSGRVGNISQKSRGPLQIAKLQSKPDPTLSRATEMSLPPARLGDWSCRNVSIPFVLTVTYHIIFIYLIKIKVYHHYWVKYFEGNWKFCTHKIKKCSEFWPLASDCIFTVISRSESLYFFCAHNLVKNLKFLESSWMCFLMLKILWYFDET